MGVNRFQKGKANPSVVRKAARDEIKRLKQRPMPPCFAKCPLLHEMALTALAAKQVKLSALVHMYLYASVHKEDDVLMKFLAKKGRQRGRLLKRICKFLDDEKSLEAKQPATDQPPTAASLHRLRALQTWCQANPGFCTTRKEIIRHFTYPVGSGEHLTLGQLKTTIAAGKLVDEPFRCLQLSRQPKLMTALNAEAYIQYLECLRNLPKGSLCLFYDQFPVSTEAGKGASSAQKVKHKIIAPAGVKAAGGEGRRTTGKTYQVSILIWKEKIIKIWPHGLTKGETGINKQGGTMDGSAVEFFFRGQQAVPEELVESLRTDYSYDIDLIGGDTIPALLAKEKLQRVLIFADCLGRGGTSDRPMTAHFNAELQAYLARHGITWALLPPAGCEGNPVELINGEVQRKIALAPPDAALPKSYPSSATRVGGPTCRPQLIKLMDEA